MSDGRTGGLGALPEPLGLLIGPPGARPDEIGSVLRDPSVDGCRRALDRLSEIEGDLLENVIWAALVRAWLAFLTGDPDLLDLAVRGLAPVLANPAASLELGAAALLLRGVATAETRGDLGRSTRDLTLAVELYDAAACHAECALTRWTLARTLLERGMVSEAETQAARARGLLDVASDPAEYAVVTGGLARIRLTGAHTSEGLDLALELWEDAIDAAVRAGSSMLRARLEAALGAALQAIAGPSSEHLRRAVACLRSALGVLEPPGASLPVGLATEAATLRLELGTALQGLGGDALTDAFDQYHRALGVLTLDDHPLEYALIHTNLATAYLAMAGGGERSTMRQALAVQSYEEALRVYSAEEFPAEHAMVQNNLANALQYLPSVHPLENLDRAVRAYWAALEIRTAEGAPLEHARTQANLANALRNFPAEDRRQTLADSARAYDVALGIFRRHGHLEETLLVEEARDEVEGELSRLLSFPAH